MAENLRKCSEIARKLEGFIKAQRGRTISVEEAAREMGLSEDDIRRCLGFSGDFSQSEDHFGPTGTWQYTPASGGGTLSEYDRHPENEVQQQQQDKSVAQLELDK